MKIAAVIAEYNPFHNGHLYQLNTIREKLNADRIIVVMSGNFTQRGIPSMIDKFARCKMALENGADVVFELPVYYATGSAEFFAQGAVSLLDKLSNNASLVIPVLKNNDIVDLSFDEKCNVLFKAPVKNNLALKALLDIIFGLKNPCGKLCFSYPNNVNQVNLEKENN